MGSEWGKKVKKILEDTTVECLVPATNLAEVWQTYGWLFWTPHQVEWDAEKKVLTVHDRKAMEILRKANILSELETEGIKVVGDIHPREEPIKIYGALPKVRIPE